MADVEFVGARGDDIARNAPHSRFDCVVHPVDKESPNAAAALVCCDMCYCWVCDVPAKTCAEWTAHCVANRSIEWMTVRNKAQRMKNAREAGVPTEAPNVVGARFAAAAQADAQPAAQQADESSRETFEQAAQDEENEDLFAEYEPLHWREGQRHPDPVVETTSLSFAELPRITYQVALLF
uniref:Uncharacterized protein n=1 Tax=Chrysotila carterae TaxID=13221 RepID=A0A7S4B7A0_CHRCT